MAEDPWRSETLPRLLASTSLNDTSTAGFPSRFPNPIPK